MKITRGASRLSEVERALILHGTWTGQAFDDLRAGDRESARICAQAARKWWRRYLERRQYADMSINHELARDAVGRALAESAEEPR